jgi:hypothetical protein
MPDVRHAANRCAVSHQRKRVGGGEQGHVDRRRCRRESGYQVSALCTLVLHVVIDEITILYFAARPSLRATTLRRTPPSRLDRSWQARRWPTRRLRAASRRCRARRRASRRRSTTSKQRRRRRSRRARPRVRLDRRRRARRRTRALRQPAQVWQQQRRLRQPLNPALPSRIKTEAPRKNCKKALCVLV